MINDKLKSLRDTIATYESVVVGYSGGVDSSLLLYIAQEVLGNKAIGVLITTPLISEYEISNARNIAKEHNLNYTEISFNNLRLPEVMNNQKDRCYYCKKEIMQQLINMAKDKNISTIAEGSNMDDIYSYRPGQKAIIELGIKSPFIDCNIKKAKIREIAKELGLKNHDKPATPCLATRYPYGSTITYDNLTQIVNSEEYLRSIGLTQFRLRHHDNLARIEVDRSELEIIQNNINEINQNLSQLGYEFVTLDLEPLKSGSFDNKRIKL